MVTFKLPYFMLELRYYLGRDGENPFEGWFSGLDAAAKALWADYKRQRPKAR